MIVNRFILKTFISLIKKSELTPNLIVRIIKNPKNYINYLINTSDKIISRKELSNEKSYVINKLKLSKEIVSKDLKNQIIRKNELELSRLFNLYGSDKSTVHNYEIIYCEILKPIRSKKILILEIGIGTNNIKFKSNMGVNGKPGASLRALRDYCPLALVVGADIDKEILIQEDRIRSFYVDQFKPESFAEIDNFLVQNNLEIDLLIIDGVHEPTADVNSIVSLIKHLSPGGTIVVEDIKMEYLEIWKTVENHLRDRYQCYIRSTKSRFVFILKA